MSGAQTAFSVPNKSKKGGFAWVWMERIDPKKSRVANPSVIAIRTASLDDKEALLMSDPEGTAIFTEPHYNGYPAILVRLANIELGELEELITEGWRSQAPKELVKEFDLTQSRQDAKDSGEGGSG
jgi:hypothetical protein